MKPLFAVGAFCALMGVGAVGWSQDSGGLNETAVEPNATVTITVQPSFSFSGVNHVANGVALRNRCSGTIPLRGIAPGSSLKSAFLYWNFMNGSAVGAATDTENFNGRALLGTKIADQPDLCWGTKGDHTYRAVIPALPVGDYNFGARTCNDNSGANPWTTGSKGPVIWDGASLVETYSNSTTTSGRVAIFDKLAGASNSNAGAHSFSVRMSTGTGPVLRGAGLFTQIGADGQVGTSFSPLVPGGQLGTDERDTFDNVLLTGPGGVYPQSEWDGNNGQPLEQLWDTHTLDVDFNGTSINTDTTTVTFDCIAAVAYIEQQGGF